MALRVIHTGDWHLGHSLHDQSRDFEHAAFLSWLADTIVSKSVDALVIAGDVFDSANPPTAAMTMYYEFLASLAHRAPGLDVVVVGGNHDSAARLDAPQALLSSLGVSVVGGVRGRDLEQLVVPLHDANKQVAAWVAAMPFVRPAELPPCPDADDPLIEGVRELYRRVVSKARERCGQSQALLATGHCYMVGSEISSLSERRVLAGNQHALPADIFDEDIAYVALGHLHKAQRVGRRENLRYAGSPLPLSLGEAGYTHQVMLIDFEGALRVGQEALIVPRAIEIIRLPSAGIDEVLAELRSLPELTSIDDPARPYLEVSVVLKEPVPNLREQIEDATVGKRPRLLKIQSEYQGDRQTLSEHHTGQRLADLDPQDVLLRRYSRDYEGEPSPELLAAFHELIGDLDQPGLL